MAILRNPFTPTFGIVPPFMAGRTYVIEDILNALDSGPGDPNLSTIFVGARGTGKTVLLSYLAGEALAHGWISVNVVAGPHMREDIYQQVKYVAKEYIEATDRPQLKGITIAQLFGVEWETAPRNEPNWRLRMSELLQGLEKYDIGLLITVDEVSASKEEMIEFASTYQLFVREGRRIGLLMAGLPHQVSMLLRNESVSFLRRSVQHHLSGVQDGEVAEALKKTIESAGRSVTQEALDRMVEAIGGFPFMMQLVGYRTWGVDPNERELTLDHAERGIMLAQEDLDRRVLDPTYFELSDGDLRFLEAMLVDDGESRISDIADRMGVTSNYASKYRARLAEQGIIRASGRGRVAFDMPHFREYLLQKQGE